MRLQPVKRYQEAHFPTKDELNSSSAVLRAVPKRWQRNVAVCALLAGIGIVAVPQSAGNAAPEASPVVARIAPLFPYPGMLNRMGIMGEIAVPDFLDEEDACKIIREEAAKAGISFTADAHTLQVPMPVSEPQQEVAVNFTIKKIPLTLDGADNARNISFEFVSNADMAAWGKQGVTTLGMNSHAEMLRAGMSQGVPAGTYAVFYDPASLPLQGVELRQQVKEFIAWLKAEGVI